MKSLLKASVEKTLNEAIGHELYASNLYKHVANQLQRLGYFGAQKFFAKESADELTHYQRVVDFINDMGCVAEVPAVAAMDAEVRSLSDALQTAYDTELELLMAYSGWFEKADVVTQQFLLQFIEIQRKSVGEYGDLLARLARVADDSCGILLLDQEMGAQ